MTSEQNENNLNFKLLEGIIGIEEAIKIQKEKLESLRNEVKNLRAYLDRD